MKLSVSVPDVLWLKARVPHPGLSPSALIQRALSDLVEGAEPTGAQLQEFWRSLAAKEGPR